MLNRIATVMIYGARLAPLCIPINAKSASYYAMVTENFHDSSVTCEKWRRKIAAATTANFDLINPATNATLDNHSCTKLILVQ